MVTARAGGRTGSDLTRARQPRMPRFAARPTSPTWNGSRLYGAGGKSAIAYKPDVQPKPQPTGTNRQQRRFRSGDLQSAPPSRTYESKEQQFGNGALAGHTPGIHVRSEAWPTRTRPGKRPSHIRRRRIFFRYNALHGESAVFSSYRCVPSPQSVETTSLTAGQSLCATRPAEAMLTRDNRPQPHSRAEGMTLAAVSPAQP